MTYARQSLVSLNDTPFYHVVARCVRRAWLWGREENTGRDYSHRKQWVIDRLKFLVSMFAIDVCAYAIMSNHYHLALHVDRSRARGWTQREVIEQWRLLYNVPSIVQRWLDGEGGESERVEAERIIEKLRERLHDISWFMRCLNEHLARRANAEDNCKGRFWGVPRTRRRDPRRCCGEDEGRPLGVAVQTVASNRPLLLRPKDVVVSEWERRRVACVG